MRRSDGAGAVTTAEASNMNAVKTILAAIGLAAVIFLLAMLTGKYLRTRQPPEE